MYRRIPERWSRENVQKAVKNATSIRAVIANLGLVPAGGNCIQCYRHINAYNLDTRHFTGKAWRKGKTIPRKPIYSLDELLIESAQTSRINLKRRLFSSGLKTPMCEECGWTTVSEGRRIPVELDHVNGVNTDNRLSNLRILCPSCHSLKPTHRGSNIKLRRRDGGIG